MYPLKSARVTPVSCDMVLEVVPLYESTAEEQTRRDGSGTMLVIVEDRGPEARKT